MEDPDKKQFIIQLKFIRGVNEQLEIKVYQIIPDFKFSNTELDFGEIKEGSIKIIYFLLEIIKVMPAGWNLLKNKTGKPKLEVTRIFFE